MECNKVEVVVGAEETSENMLIGKDLKAQSETFWTMCGICRICYEFNKTWLNQNLLCPPCQQTFLATEIPAPPFSRGLRRVRKKRRKNVQSADEGTQGTASGGENAEVLPANTLVDLNSKFPVGPEFIKEGEISQNS